MKPRRYWMWLGLGAVVLGLVAVGCNMLETPPVKVATPLPVSNVSAAAHSASLQFWAALHDGNYPALPNVIALLDAANRAQPNDATITMLLGMSYAWLYFEQERNAAPRADPAFQALLPQAAARAASYLVQAQKLAPNDRVIPGFVAATQFVLAKSQNDAAREAAAYQALLANTRAYPQFQGFVQGWVLTALYAPNQPQFADGFNGYFDSLNACVGFKVSREDPSAPGFVFNVLSKADPACYNTDIAPHNLEGTFMGLGDAYAKQGKLQQAREAYGNAQRTPSYQTWKYQKELEARLAQLEQLPAKFAADSGQLRVAQEPALFFQSRYSCVACHAQ